MNKITFQGYLQTGCIDIISQYFPLVSVTPKSEPTAGSMCFPTSKLKSDFFVSSHLQKLVRKRNGDFVAYYDGVTLRFWKGDEKT